MCAYEVLRKDTELCWQEIKVNLQIQNLLNSKIFFKKRSFSLKVDEE